MAVGSRGSMVRAPAAKAGGSIPGDYPVFFLFQLAYAYTNANGLRICGALVQFGYYQHRHE